MLFNYRFDSTSPPVPGVVTVASFRSCSPQEWSVPSLVPAAQNGPFVRGDCNGDASRDLGVEARVHG